MKILVTDEIAAAGLEQLQNLPEMNIVMKVGLSKEQLLNEIADADALLVRSQTKVTAEVIEAAQQLRVIGRAGVGVDNIDVAAATRRGIVVVNAPDGNTMAAAEHTFAMMIALARHLPQAYQSVQKHEWKRSQFIGVELRGKTLAVIGMGRIGTEVAKRALAFDMQVLGYDPFLTDERAQALGVQRVEVDEAFARADFVTIHTPLIKETRHLINADRLRLMKEGVRIINCARGGIIDEQALADAISSGKVAGAALDVFEQEPIPAEHPLRGLSNVILTPHLGASTVEAQTLVATSVAEEVAHILQGLPFENAVNVPSVKPEQKEYLAPYLLLGEKIGLFLGQWVTRNVKDLEITFTGDLANHDSSFVTRTVLKGLLGNRHGDEVNYVNAPVLAKESGLSVREVRQTESKVFTTMLSVAITSDEGRHQVSGTLYNGSGPRIIEISGYRIDVEPEGPVLLTEHDDKPGIIGQIGTLLGREDINIAGMQVGRQQTGGQAIMVLSVDKLVPENVLNQIEQISGMHVVRTIEL